MLNVSKSGFLGLNQKAKSFKNMKGKLKLASLSIILSAITQPTLAGDNTQNWIVRGRVVQVQTDVSSKVSTLGGHVATSSDQIPELDFTRFFTKNIAAELILGTSQNDVKLKGSALGGGTSLGSVRLLPPTLTLQYHFNPEGTFRPYAGAGLNYTIFYNSKAPSNSVVTSVKYQNHIGYAFQAGFDYMLNDTWSLNVDVKKIYLNTNVQVNDAYTAKVRLNPWLFGVGLGYHF